MTDGGADECVETDTDADERALTLMRALQEAWKRTTPTTSLHSCSGVGSNGKEDMVLKASVVVAPSPLGAVAVLTFSLTGIFKN
jgi:hypothetical protein